MARVSTKALNLLQPPFHLSRRTPLPSLAAMCCWRERGLRRRRAGGTRVVSDRQRRTPADAKELRSRERRRGSSPSRDLEGIKIRVLPALSPPLVVVEGIQKAALEAKVDVEVGGDPGDLRVSGGVWSVCIP